MKKIPFLYIAAVVILISLAVLLFFVFNKQQSEQPVQETEDLGQVLNNEMFIISLDAQNNSGQSGTATFTEVPGGKVKVTISMKGGNYEKETQPAHIHSGACPKPGAVKHKLINLLAGASETILDVSIDELLTSGEMAVNVHKSDKESTSYTACGNLPKLQ